MKGKAPMGVVKLAVLFLVVLPLALLIMRVLHVLLVGRDIRHEPVLLILLSLASLVLSMALTAAAIIAVFAADDLLRRRGAKDRAEGEAGMAGVESTAAQWLQKAMRLLAAGATIEALKCLKVARRLASRNPEQQTARDLRALQQQQTEAGVAALSKGRVEEACGHSEIAFAADDRMPEPMALLTAGYALRVDEPNFLKMWRVAHGAGFSARLFRDLVKGYLEIIPAAAWENLRFDETAALCEKVSVELCRVFDIPGTLLPFLAGILRHPTFRQHDDWRCEVRCSGLDAKFLAEFLRLFHYNSLSSMNGRQAVEVVRKAYWSGKEKWSQRAPPPWKGVDGYFHRLKDVLIDTGVLGFIREPAPYWDKES